MLADSETVGGAGAPSAGGIGDAALPDGEVLARGEHAARIAPAGPAAGRAVVSAAGSDLDTARNSEPEYRLSTPARALSPAEAYLATVGPRSRRTLAGDILRIVGIVRLGRGIPNGAGAQDWRAFPWHRLTPADTTALRRALADQLAPATVNRMLACLRGVLRAGWRLGLIDADTLARLGDLPRVRGKAPLRGRALTVAETRALLAVCQHDKTPKNIRDYAILSALIYCGLRRAELVGLDVGDCDLERAELLIRRAKGGVARTVRIPPEALQPLAMWLDLRGSNAKAAALFVPAYDTALAGERRLDPQSVYEMLRRRCAQAGVRRCSPHDLRRTFITRLLERGTDLGRVQRAAGHADLGTTLRYDRRT